MGSKKKSSLPGGVAGPVRFVPVKTTLPSTAAQPAFFPDGLPFQVTSVRDALPYITACDIAYTPTDPPNWSPVPTTVCEALDQLAARPTRPMPTWTFTGAAPLLGEGWYVSNAQTVTRAFAGALGSSATADADGVYDGVTGQLVTESGTECSMRLEPGLVGGDAPAPGSLLYTSWTTAGLFTTVPPTFGSGNYHSLRGKCVDVSSYNPAAPTGSAVRAIFRPVFDFGPV